MDGWEERYNLEAINSASSLNSPMLNSTWILVQDLEARRLWKSAQAARLGGFILQGACLLFRFLLAPCLRAIRSGMGLPPVWWPGAWGCFVPWFTAWRGPLVSWSLLGTCSICPSYGKIHAAICLQHCHENGQSRSLFETHPMIMLGIYTLAWKRRKSSQRCFRLTAVILTGRHSQWLVRRYRCQDYENIILCVWFINARGNGC